ncbi:hypothetical protein AB0M80_41500 [Amycolatopsis sp. NPDC051045]|uniref:hypothetical protein n=1 Tax=Amycolatopsis sp. NPDC051045 TaxID=3156922 RepID=UPI00341B29F6
MRIGDRRRLRRDPLDYPENLHRRSVAEVIRLPQGGWCVSHPEPARQLLRGPEFTAGKSGFFRQDLLPTRVAQVEVGHAVCDVLRARLPDYCAALPAAVADLPAVSRWPAAGNRLVCHCLADLLLHRGTPAGTRGSLRLQPVA